MREHVHACTLLTGKAMPTRAPLHVAVRRPKRRIRSSDGREYDSAWRKLRAAFLLYHPVCECEEHRGKDLRARAEVVDHIEPISDRPDLRLDWDNLRSMMKRCHDRRTMKDQNRRGQMLRDI